MHWRAWKEKHSGAAGAAAPRLERWHPRAPLTPLPSRCCTSYFFSTCLSISSDMAAAAACAAAARRVCAPAPAAAACGVRAARVRRARLSGRRRRATAAAAGGGSWRRGAAQRRACIPLPPPPRLRRRQRAGDSPNRLSVVAAGLNAGGGRRWQRRCAMDLCVGRGEEEGGARACVAWPAACKAPRPRPTQHPRTAPRHLAGIAHPRLAVSGRLQVPRGCTSIPTRAVPWSARLRSPAQVTPGKGVVLHRSSYCCQCRGLGMARAAARWRPSLALLRRG